MSRQLIAVLLMVSASSSAWADAPGETPPVAVTAKAPETIDVGDREVGVQLGVASGAHTTPGGLRIAGHFLYQMSDSDWFEALAAVTYGSSAAGCFRDRGDAYVCQHGLADGFSVDLGVGLRRFFEAQRGFRPYARLAVAARVLRFGDDRVSGFAIPVIAGAGVRVRVSDSLAVGGEGAVEVGPGWLGRGVGTQLERGLTVGAFAEVALP